MVARGLIISSSTSRLSRHFSLFECHHYHLEKPTNLEGETEQIMNQTQQTRWFWALFMPPSLICFPDAFSYLKAAAPGSLTLCRCLWMLSCDQIPHWDADEGPTCFRLRSWLWRQPPGLFVLPAVISTHHPQQRLTGSPPPPFSQAAAQPLYVSVALLCCVNLC